MTVINLERRIRKIEARRFAVDSALRGMPDDELAHALRDVSDDPADQAFANWFQAGANGPLPPGALDTLRWSL